MAERAKAQAGAIGRQPRRSGTIWAAATPRGFMDRPSWTLRPDAERGTSHLEDGPAEANHGRAGARTSGVAPLLPRLAPQGGPALAMKVEQHPGPGKTSSLPARKT
jgi:hypothetical protein